MEEEYNSAKKVELRIFGTTFSDSSVEHVQLRNIFVIYLDHLIYKSSL